MTCYFGEIKININDFCSLIEVKFGWAVAEQARSILIENAPFEDQNENALELIADFARSKKETELYTDLIAYLKEKQ